MTYLLRWSSWWRDSLNSSDSIERLGTTFRNMRRRSADRGFGGIAAKLVSDLQGKEETHGFNRSLPPSASPRLGAKRRNNTIKETTLSSEDLAILEQLNNDHVLSDQFGNVKRFSEFLADDFIVQLPGVNRNRAEFLEYVVKPRPFKDLAVHDVKIRMLSDVALIHGRSTYTMLADGAQQEALYTDAYQKRDGLCLGLRDRSGRLTAPATRWVA